MVALTTSARRDSSSPGAGPLEPCRPDRLRGGWPLPRAYFRKRLAPGAPGICRPKQFAGGSPRRTVGDMRAPIGKIVAQISPRCDDARAPLCSCHIGRQGAPWRRIHPASASGDHDKAHATRPHAKAYTTTCRGGCERCRARRTSSSGESMGLYCHIHFGVAGLRPNLPWPVFLLTTLGWRV